MREKEEVTKKHIWSSALSSQKEEFRKILRIPTNKEKIFNEDFIKEISKKKELYTAKYIKSLSFYAFPILLLYFSQSLQNTELSLFGLKLKNLSNFKEIIVLALSFTSLPIFFYYSYSKKLEMMIEVWIEENHEKTLEHSYQ
ncbi:hypothetical protein J3369_19285 [Alteromonas sp. NFXS44]|uniref:hypothetical protein n=1 Tax=Alteromonas sp. NFXS44 TaxID=2818435 RepID=UPI0032DE435C